MRVGSSTVEGGALNLEAAEKTARLEAKAEGAATKAVHPSDEPSPFARMLHGLGQEMNRGEQLMSTAIHGGSSGTQLDNGSLLALQAGVYRYSEAVDLSAKLVDRASSGVKTILQGQ